MKDAAKQDVVRSATGRLIRINYVLAAAMTFLAVFSLWTGSFVASFFMVACAAFALWSARFSSRSGREAYDINTAYQRYFAGKTAAAHAELDALETKPLMQYIRRAASLQRTAIAFHEGNLDAAAHHAKRAAAGKAETFTRVFERRYMTEARAYLALFGALRGDVPDAALEHAIRSDPEHGATALARLELSHIVRLDHENRVEDLQRAVAKHRVLLREALSRRERELLHAIQRKLTRRSPGVYRQAAEREAEREAEADALDAAAWAERVAPALAPFIRTVGGASSGDVTLPTAGTASARGEAKPSSTTTPSTAGAKVLLRVLGIFAAAMAVLGGALVFTMSAEPGHRGGASAASLILGAPVFVLAAFAAYVTYLVRTQRSARRALAAATRTAAMGLPPDEAQLGRLQKSRYPVIAAEAALIAAREARKAGRFDVVEERTRSGIARAVSTQQARVVSSYLLLPTLLAERAAALAALDRTDEALAELRQLETSFPAFAMLPIARHAVATMIAARRGDHQELIALGKASQTLPAMDYRTQLLGDLARAAREPEGVGAAEVARLEQEIAQDADVRAWVGSVQPSLLDLSPRGDHGSDAEVGVAEAEADAETEAAHAEVTAAHGGEAGATRRVVE